MRLRGQRSSLGSFNACLPRSALCWRHKYFELARELPNNKIFLEINGLSQMCNRSVTQRCYKTTTLNLKIK